MVVVPAGGATAVNSALGASAAPVPAVAATAAAAIDARAVAEPLQPIEQL